MQKSRAGTHAATSDGELSPYLFLLWLLSAVLIESDGNQPCRNLNAPATHARTAITFTIHGQKGCNGTLVKRLRGGHQTLAGGRQTAAITEGKSRGKKNSSSEVCGAGGEKLPRWWRASVRPEWRGAGFSFEKRSASSFHYTSEVPAEGMRLQWQDRGGTSRGPHHMTRSACQCRRLCVFVCVCALSDCTSVCPHGINKRRRRGKKTRSNA